MSLNNFLNEEALGRFVKILNDDTLCFGILTASRTGNTPEQDKADNKMLRALVRTLNMGYRRVKGQYPEGGKMHIDDSVIVATDEKRRDILYKFCQTMRKRFNQESFLFKECNGTVKLVYDTYVSNLGKFHPNGFGEMMSTFKNGRTFTFESITSETLYGHYTNHLGAMWWNCCMRDLGTNDDKYLNIVPTQYMNQDEDIL